ncbi:hypothetical protein [Dactylosporangium sp. CA-233914]|uniref:hypothetical protein n=1 Tax=Dactylosporangium sp. CA-233914 TaxID=3239934 RepID=UPI003D91D8AF
MSVVAARVPFLGGMRLRRAVAPAGFEGATVPGLSVRFYHRAERGRTASLGSYRYAGWEVLRAWGWADQPHCAFSAVRGRDGRWGPVTTGCPDVETLTEEGVVVGVRLGALLCRDGRVLTAAAEAIPGPRR